MTKLRPHGVNLFPDTMELKTLYVAEFAPHVSVTSLPTAAQSVEFRLLEIRTCQRTVFVGFHEPALFKTHHPKRAFRAEHAYEYLLRFTCGLESQIKGETDVFGQVKTALKNFSESAIHGTAEFDSLFQRIFEDTKEIRAVYLQGIGGNTYGTLARRILNPTPQDRVLILGAGQISKSVACYFQEFSLVVWNRSSDRLQDLLTSKPGGLNIETKVGYEKLEKALSQCTQVIAGTPAKSEVDHYLLKEAKKRALPILHLGGQQQDLAAFQSLPNVWSLTDLFALESDQTQKRTRQVERAEVACHHRATLRRMSRSLSTSHGWEDLALFTH